MAIETQDGDTLQFDDKLFCLFKGDPGTAKSPAAGSFPEPYFFDVEGRIQSTINYWRGKKKIRFNTFLNNYPGMMDKMESLIHYNPYGTIVMDGFTALSRSLNHLSFAQRGTGEMGKRKRIQGEDKGEREYAKIGAKGDFKGIQLLEIDDFGVENNGIIQVLDGMRALWNGGKGCHCICIGHVIEVENKDLRGKITYTRRMMTGGKKIAAEIPIYFNEAYHFTCDAMTNERKFKAITKNVGDDWAKSALPLPEEIDFTDRNLFVLIQYFIDEYKKANAGLFTKKEETNEPERVG